MAPTSVAQSLTGLAADQRCAASAQVAAMQAQFPRTVVCSYMSYLQEDADEAPAGDSEGAVSARANNPR